MKQRTRQRMSAYLAETDCDQSEVLVAGFFSLSAPAGFADRRSFPLALPLAVLRSPLLASMSAGDAMSFSYTMNPA